MCGEKQEFTDALMSCPLVPLDDLPVTENPGLRFGQYSSQIADLIRNSPNGHLAVGVFGGYGTGKTTLMRNVQNKLSSENPKIITAWFPAWRYDQSSEPLFLPLLAVINKAIKEKCTDDGLNGKIRAAAKGFIRSLSFKVNLAGLEISSDMDKARENEDELLKQYLDDLIGDYKDVFDLLDSVVSVVREQGIEQIVIFVDDLDRCVPEKAAKVIESIKAFMDIDNLSFVIGLDHRSIQKYLEVKFSKNFIDSTEYLDKIIQVPFVIPEPDPRDVQKLVCDLLCNLKKQKDDSPAISTWISSILSILSDKALGNSLPTNVRIIKRILNNHQVLSFGLNEFQSQFLLLGLIMQNRYPTWFSVFKSHRRSPDWIGNVLRMASAMKRNHSQTSDIDDQVFSQLILDIQEAIKIEFTCAPDNIYGFFKLFVTSFLRCQAQAEEDDNCVLTWEKCQAYAFDTVMEKIA